MNALRVSSARVSCLHLSVLLKDRQMGTSSKSCRSLSRLPSLSKYGDSQQEVKQAQSRGKECIPQRLLVRLPQAADVNVEV